MVVADHAQRHAIFERQYNAARRLLREHNGERERRLNPFIRLRQPARRLHEKQCPTQSLTRRA